MSTLQANVDMVGPEGGRGELASQLTSGELNMGRMRPWIGDDGKTYVTIYKGGPANKQSSYEVLQTNDKGTLRRDEFRQLDDAVQQIAEERLTGVQDIINRGLVFNLGNAMGTTVLEHHTISDAMEAQLSMDAVTRGKGDRVEFDTVFLPIPIIHVDYEINQRALNVSRRLGNPLDTTMAQKAARKVMEKREDLLFGNDNTAFKFSKGQVFSFLNHPNRTQHGLSDWANPNVTGEEIVDDVLVMKQKSINSSYFGPWVLYVATNFETKLDEDFSPNKGDRTIRDRLLAINNLEDIVVVDRLPDDNVVLVQMTSDTIRIVQGTGIQNVQWEALGGFVNKFKSMTIQVPQVRGDQEGKMGLIHGTVSST